MEGHGHRETPVIGAEHNVALRAGHGTGAPGRSGHVRLYQICDHRGHTSRLPPLLGHHGRRGAQTSYHHFSRPRSSAITLSALYAGAKVTNP